jgi:16S rRNA (cytosine967-C5)-methyltransferase
LARPPVSDARRVAWEVLSAVEHGAFADAQLGARLRASPLDPRDRAFATQLVYGTLAWQGLADHVLAQLGRDARRIDAPIRVLLRMAVFQLVRLDRVPDFAVVDTAVELAKHGGRRAAAGLVNALLRRFIHTGKRVAMPSRERDAAAHLSVRYSHPLWLVHQWLAEIGEDGTEALLAADNVAAPTVVRTNRRRTDRDALAARLAADGVSAVPARFAPDALLLESRTDPVALAAFREGLFAVQGEASQLVTALLDPPRGGRVLDVSAAPGGKALAIADRIGPEGRVLAVDRNRPGLEQVRREAARLGTAVAIIHADATALPLRPAWTADAVLVDAPCSGLGTLRQHPEIRWRRRPEDIAALAVLQRRLLAAAAVHVRVGGTLVYATCTISAAENAAVVDWFVSTFPDFRRDDPRPHLPTAAHALIDAAGHLRTFPHRDGLDGFFAARLVRIGAG